MSKLICLSRAFRAFAFGFALSLGMVAGLFTSPVLADIPAVASHAKIQADATQTLFSIALSRAVEAQAFVLQNPARAIIDVSEIKFQLQAHSDLKGGLVNAYRYGLFGPAKSRIVLDLTAPSAITAFRLEKTEQGARLVLNLTLEQKKASPSLVHKLDEKGTEVTATVAPALAKADRQQALKPKVAVVAEAAKPLIVLDPGHGGVDPGALSPDGVAEKEIVLAFAASLQSQLKATGRFQVIMTRQDDRFLALNQRVAIAQRHKADLFLSIHADKLAEPGVRGTSIYTLSEKASDREAALLAEKENRVDILGGVDVGAVDEEVTDILIELTQRETRTLSLRFAHLLADEMKRQTRLVKNPLRSAAFRVLKAPDVPSALIELGYLSSREDFKMMMSDEWRGKATAAAVKAIEGFFKNRMALAEPADPLITGSLPVASVPLDAGRPSVSSVPVSSVPVESEQVASQNAAKTPTKDVGADLLP